MGNALRSARWRSQSGLPAPRRTVLADDTLTADAAYRLACEGTALLWRGDFQNARQLLQALARRLDKKPRAGGKPAPEYPEAFHRKRMAQAQRARILGMLLIPFDAGHVIPLRRAPDVCAACEEVYGKDDAPYVASLRELLGLVGAHEWRKKGVAIPALGGRIHPHYGVFSPVRGEYVGLVADVPLPASLAGNSLPSTLVPVPAYWPQCWRARHRARRGRLIRMSGRWPARAKTLNGSDWATGSSWSRPTCFRPAARRSSSAIRRGCRASRVRRSNTLSTTPTAACCAVFSPVWRRISKRAARAG
jgi:hypothetical protein